MKSVGDTLKSARERKKIPLEAIASTTHVRLEYLKAIEHNSFHILPSQVAARGFITLYAQSVGLHPDGVLALYRRDVQLPAEDEGVKLQKSWLFLKSKKTRRFGVLVVMLALVTGFCMYAGSVLYSLGQAPPLTIISPKPNSRVASPLTIRGTTLTDAVVYIDGTATGVNQNGEFIDQEELAPGSHVLTIKAVGRNGKENVQEVEVTVEAPTQ